MNIFRESSERAFARRTIASSGEAPELSEVSEEEEEEEDDDDDEEEEEEEEERRDGPAICSS